MIISILALFLYIPCLADPNSFPYDRWLEPVAVIDHIWYKPADNDPNLLLKVVKQEVVHRFDLSDFAIYARQYQGDPNYIPPEPPTMPQDANEPEPNEVQAQAVFCFTVGGKHHLYEDCRYIVGKEYKPCLCDPNSLCLTCKSRALAEDWLE